MSAKDTISIDITEMIASIDASVGPKVARSLVQAALKEQTDFKGGWEIRITNLYDRAPKRWEMKLRNLFKDQYDLMNTIVEKSFVAQVSDVGTRVVALEDIRLFLLERLNHEE